MNVISEYRELAKEIDILVERIEDLTGERQSLIRKMYQGPSDKVTASYDGQPHAKFTHEPLDKQYMRMIEIEEKLDDLYTSIKAKNGSRKAIEDKMKELEGLQAKIYYRHKIEGKTLVIVAEELNITYEHCRRVHADIYKEKAPAI